MHSYDHIFNHKLSVASLKRAGACMNEEEMQEILDRYGDDPRISDAFQDEDLAWEHKSWLLTVYVWCRDAYPFDWKYRRPGSGGLGWLTWLKDWKAKNGV